MGSKGTAFIGPLINLQDLAHSTLLFIGRLLITVLSDPGLVLSVAIAVASRGAERFVNPLRNG